MATPLSFLLAKTIRLDKGVRVSRVARLADGFCDHRARREERDRRPDHRHFKDNPLTLVGWTVLDPQGRTTRVQLQGLQRVRPRQVAVRAEGPAPEERGPRQGLSVAVAAEHTQSLIAITL
jgi:hypothetical protein